MDLHHPAGRNRPATCLLLACALTPLVVFLTSMTGRNNVAAADADILRIGTSGPLTGHEAASKTEAGACGILQNFIADSTGVDNQIVHCENWCDLADAMDKGQLQMGIFQGYEFAWVQSKHPRIKPLALAINGSRYPVACLVVRHDNAAEDFTGLEGVSLDIPIAGPAFHHLFIKKQCQNRGKTLESFFSSITSQKNVEDALDDVVDAKVQAVALDRAAVEAYKRRKPNRFNQLKEVARSQPFPPVVIAYCDKSIKLTTLLSFQHGFKDVSKKATGETMMMLLRLTDFERIPTDFGKVLAQTRKVYPPPAIATIGFKQSVDPH